MSGFEPAYLFCLPNNQTCIDYYPNTLNFLKCGRLILKYCWASAEVANDKMKQKEGHFKSVGFENTFKELWILAYLLY